ncbi:beta-phosphoglucomutase [Clostridium sp. CM028]|uniref:beta-phosphoglucomutase n=1 Tax=unclassified Clostridium TaxID=2614128 RepID=UPI001C0C8CCD|nr:MULTISPECIES: beta-phosphoglucomutase [unclassified Clostridium]MBU3092121.1 beta-phosphoglucomutase [Clostridium sp. CF011]MBW9146668.1 beta-phosphoglucomutase [Clostridium sp. CM027]MBW9149104.1 beta-phosphoglucomutase [Clostridium sp. CM028]UVE42011.1 beta-phosphoglucomutase [Clostridium sp. CM027]WAG71038.1 beta-phosphoglucomutase [Clostridium sp. CF011]
MTKIKACLFDLDGVIVDTAKYHYLAWRRLAKELGFDFTKEQNESLKGISRMESLKILLNIGGLTLTEAEKMTLAEKKNNWYREYILKMTPDEILPGTVEFLEELKNNGIKIALGSASKNAMTILNNIKLVNHFDAIIDGTKTSNAKPDPEVFLLGAKELGVSPSECVVFEDAKAGIESAINAGMYSVGIGDPLVLNKANIVVSSLKEMTFEKLNY